MPEHALKTTVDDHETRIQAVEGAPGGGPTIQAGTVNLAAGGTSAVTFSPAFASAPRVFLTAQFNNADTSCTYSAHTISETGFTMRGAGNPAGSVAWMAVL